MQVQTTRSSVGFSRNKQHLWNYLFVPLLRIWMRLCFSLKKNCLWQLTASRRLPQLWLSMQIITIINWFLMWIARVYLCQTETCCPGVSRTSDMYEQQITYEDIKVNWLMHKNACVLLVTSMFWLSSSLAFEKFCRWNSVIKNNYHRVSLLAMCAIRSRFATTLLLIKNACNAWPFRRWWCYRVKLFRRIQTSSHSHNWSFETVMLQDVSIFLQPFQNGFFSPVLKADHDSKYLEKSYESLSPEEQHCEIVYRPASNVNGSINDIISFIFFFVKFIRGKAWQRKINLISVVMSLINDHVSVSVCFLRALSRIFLCDRLP